MSGDLPGGKIQLYPYAYCYSEITGECENSDSEVRIRVVCSAEIILIGADQRLDSEMGLLLLPGFSYTFAALQSAMDWEVWDLLGKRK